MKNNDIEKNLKDRMNKLSDNVDCFDKICEKAYSAENSDSFDSNFTVTDLENVTGKRNAVPFIKWGLIAACAVLCIIVFPQTSFMREVFSNMSNETGSKKYNSIVHTVQIETANENNFHVYDLTIDEYMKNDFFVTPMFCCPFEDTGREDVRVRIFVRMYENIITNQVYAIEYSGEYKEENFIAAAESKAKFTDDEFAAANAAFPNIEYTICDDFAAAFLSTNKYGNISDKEGNDISAASFAYTSYFKDNKNVYPLMNYVFYSNSKDGVDSYNYRIASYTSDKNSQQAFELPDRLSGWENSFYYNGTSAMPEKIVSPFREADLPETVSENEYEIDYIMPYHNYDSSAYDNELPLNHVDILIKEQDYRQIGSLNIPNDNMYHSMLKIYVSPMSLYVSSYHQPRIVLKADIPFAKEEFSMSDMSVIDINSVKSGDVISSSDAEFIEATEQTENSEQNK